MMVTVVNTCALFYVSLLEYHRSYSSTNEHSSAGCYQASSSLDSASAWTIQALDTAPFMTIDAGRRVLVYGLVIQGSVYTDHFKDFARLDKAPAYVVTELRVTVSTDGWQWTQVLCE